MNSDGLTLTYLVSTVLIHFFTYYLFFVNTVHLALSIAAMYSLRRRRRLESLVQGLKQGFGAFAPSISIMAPAYNEQETIAHSVRSFLMLEYPSYEVVVINDGSKDQTMAVLEREFALEPLEVAYDGRLSSTPINRVYRSRIHKNLLVIDKVNGGKADALNCGIGYCRNQIFCAVDSDSLLERDALIKVAAPFLERPSLTIASGGTVRVANGAVVKAGRVEFLRLPRSYLALMQIVEYTRAFLLGRIGWNAIDSTLVISGAFGLFSREAVISVGGYQRGSIGEDMELVVRLHRKYRREKIPYAIDFVADPVCWTEAPTDLGSLRTQRDRWQRGLADTLMRNRSMIMNPTYGILGLVTLPYFLLVELFGPVLEFASFAFIAIAATFHLVDVHLLYVFFLASVFYGAMMSMLAVLIEETYFGKYAQIRQVLVLLGMSLIESVVYRPLTLVWRLTGLWKFLRGDRSWGHLSRVGFNGRP